MHERRQRAGRICCRRARSRDQRSEPADEEVYRGVLQRHRGAATWRRRWLSCACWRSCCATEDRQADRADHSGRGPHVRHGIALPQVGIYSTCGQNYEPVDLRDLAVLQGSQGRADSGRRHHRSGFDVFSSSPRERPMPHIRDQHDSLLHLLFDVRLAADWRPDLGRGRSRQRASLLGGTAGRTTLAGEGCSIRTGKATSCISGAEPAAFDPAFAYEIAVIVQEGIRRMYVEQEDIFYYITVMNETWSAAGYAGGRSEGILKGMYRLPRLRETDAQAEGAVVWLGAIMREALKAPRFWKRITRLPPTCGV